MNNSYLKLPEGYKETLHIDLQQDKKLMLIVNGIGAVVMVVMFVVGCFIVPFWAMYENGLLPWIVLLVGTVVYVFLHELVHGITMWYYSKEKPFYGFTGVYAYAGSNCYFNKKTYIIIALAPVVLWGVVLLILNFMLNDVWFWPIYSIQLFNVSGACGDMYVTWRFSKLPKDILINDVGVSMTIYSAENQVN